MTYAMTNHLRKSNTCRSPHGMTHFQRYECASCAARTSCFNMTVDADEAQRVGIVENEDTTKTYDEILVINMSDAMYEEAEAEDIKRDLVKRYAYMEGKDPKPLDFYNAEDTNTTTVAVELAHREAIAAEAIKNDINAKLAANGYTANGEAIKRE